MSTIIINVVIILGIIIAGGFLIFFVGDLLLSIVDPKTDERRIKNKKRRDAEKMNQDLNKEDPEVAEKVRKDEKIAAFLQENETKEPERLENGGYVEVFNMDAVPVPKTEEQEPVEEDEDEEETEEAQEQEDEEEKRLREAREALERRKLEILRRLQENVEEEEEEAEEPAEEPTEEPAEESTDDLFEEPAEQLIDESTEEAFEETEEPVVEEVEESVEEEPVEDNLNEERKALEEEKLRYQELIKELEAKTEAISVAAAAGAEAQPVLGKEEYQKRLEEKQEALAANEKELKECKKEFLPLDKVRRTLEKDEKRLRMKEIQVAKQQVLLYGVNNYTDIDSEKEAKLKEDLDLLDGLKKSVEHCKNVMQANKDRLPILEKMYNVLTKQNEEIKADIEHLNEVLAKFED